jgi:predicted NBD/HSP70 family sugar kinase
MIFSPSRMGRLNKRALIRQLQKAGVSSRAGLARSLGMSQPTAGKIVDELLSLKILEEVETPAVNGHGPASTRMGRPSRQLQLNRSEPRFLGIQLGITETQLAELPIGVTETDDWQVSFRIPPTQSNPVAAWERQLRTAAKKLRSHNFLGVVLSVPGVVDEASNRILFSPNIHWSESVDLAAIIRKIWKVPVLLVQEERALALGHHLANPDCEDFLLVDFGEGVGGAIIVEGKPLANSLPISGEIGHTPVLGNRRKCGCGATGCMETLVSLRGLLESFATATHGKKNSWAQLREHISAHGIKPWLAHSLDAAATAIAGSLNVIGLRRVVITGSLTELPPSVLAHLSRAVQNGSMWAKFGEVECVSAPRRRTVGLVAVGIDRLIVPDGHENRFVPGKNPHAMHPSPARNGSRAQSHN